MTLVDKDLMYMQRALQLAANGLCCVSPNPMVGAVIVAPDGRIIGEGWHRRFGGPHAEVNAVRSVSDSDRHLLAEATIYVTLEPCSHYGKTPPCAKLLIDNGLKRVVVGAGDPNPKVAGSGIAMLRDAGIEVVEHCLENDCKELNIRFMTAHTMRRPFVTLKWACSADGFMDVLRSPSEHAYLFSGARGAQLVHSRRAIHDAIAVGASTVLLDNPGLTTRLIAGRNPRPIIFDRRNKVLPGSCRLLERLETLHLTTDEPLAYVLHKLYTEEGITSMLVEGGASLLNSFIEAGLWDEAWVEIQPCALGEKGCTKAPNLPCEPCEQSKIGDNTLYRFSNIL